MRLTTHNCTTSTYSAESCTFHKCAEPHDIVLLLSANCRQSWADCNVVSHCIALLFIASAAPLIHWNSKGRRHESRLWSAQQVANKLCKYFLFIIIFLYDCYKYFIGSKIFMVAVLFTFDSSLVLTLNAGYDFHCRFPLIWALSSSGGNSNTSIIMMNEVRLHHWIFSIIIQKC